MKQNSLGSNIRLAIVALVMLIFAATIWLLADQPGEMQKELAFQNTEEMAQKNAYFAKAEPEQRSILHVPWPSPLRGLKRVV